MKREVLKIEIKLLLCLLTQKVIYGIHSGNIKIHLWWKISDNILVIGQTGCGYHLCPKYSQKSNVWQIEKSRVDFKNWTSEKKKKKKKKEQISICFTNATVDFNYAAGISESDKLIQEFSEESRNRKLQRREWKRRKQCK